MTDSDGPILSRRRRMKIGDLMMMIALVGLSMAIGAASSIPGARIPLGFFAFALLMMQTLLWRVARQAPSRDRGVTAVTMASLSLFLALSFLLCLILIGLTSANLLPLLVGTMLILAIYQTTWD